MVKFPFMLNAFYVNLMSVVGAFPSVGGVCSCAQHRPWQFPLTFSTELLITDSCNVSVEQLIKYKMIMILYINSVPPDFSLITLKNSVWVFFYAFCLFGVYCLFLNPILWRQKWLKHISNNFNLSTCDMTLPIVWHISLVLHLQKNVWL